MIAACPRCHARYRVQTEQLGVEGARLRCSQCRAVFRVRLPDAPPPAAPAAQVPLPAAPTHEAVGEGRAAPAGVHDEPRFDRERLVVVAHADPGTCKDLAELLEERGLQVLVAHDGVEAILTIQRALPCAVVLDAGLPKMFGFQVCELVKRNESLRTIHVVLVGAVYKEERYRRAPHDLYGADVYVEPHELPEALWAALARFGLPLRSDAEAARPAPSVPDAVAPVPVAAAAAVSSSPAAPAAIASPPPPAASDPLAEERARAERFARIVVSDIVLYNQDKLEAALRSGGDVLAALRDELDEGRALFRDRVDARVREERDFLAEELERVAAARRAR